MPRIKLEFPNAAGHRLAGLLEMPPERVPTRRYALFAHCFTCSKDIAAASRISRALADRGIAVLRFDFTGLGNSDGDFANTNFSSNVEDLLAAARKLEEDFQAPALLIGHSLGGAAVLAAAPQLPSVEAVVTIAAPATASHVQHLLSDARDELEARGEAEVKIGLRRFRIRKQLLEDLAQYGAADHIRDLDRPLLVFHSPLDTIVSIDEAAKIYQAARHPKSFISLDNADHMLSDREDAEYVAETLVAWASRYLGLGGHRFEQSLGTAPKVGEGEVLVTELHARFLRGLYTGRHQLLADQPSAVGGSGLGPDPYELMLMALGACTSMTLREYATAKGWDLDDVEVRLAFDRSHAADCTACEREEVRVDRVQQRINLLGHLTAGQRARLLEVAERAPVNRSLESLMLIHSELDDERLD
ncbi:bifunctional alpha/beta hydrolase/OsmC family protein [Marichromatium gracile]|uniref:Osmotically inducible protein C n=1 Tax=Marichromatium gracile TaxID=1048 RepID=A0ABR5VDM4_MARGR|nr:bifunctional alpha/beta hydrolase/OsmC family protein [Marichromatium gracile]KXX63445.1 osmotically inducible protein C [Marichromatium gracile]MCF1183123.1 bifunctional alpha/beta hydrolase/OsmC family protein [Marichromatium gracile]